MGSKERTSYNNGRDRTLPCAGSDCCDGAKASKQTSLHSHQQERDEVKKEKLK